MIKDTKFIIEIGIESWLLKRGKNIEKPLDERGRQTDIHTDKQTDRPTERLRARQEERKRQYEMKRETCEFNSKIWNTPNVFTKFISTAS